MIKEASIHNVGFVTFTLSGKWMAEVLYFLFFSLPALINHTLLQLSPIFFSFQNIYKMLIGGIDTWAPKLYAEKVMIISPSLDNDIAEGTRAAWFRSSYIINTLIRMLKYSDVPVTVFKEYPQEYPQVF